MPLTKEYFRYEASGKCNIVASASCNICYVAINGLTTRYVAVGAAEDVIIWDVRSQRKLYSFNGDQFLVTRLAASNKTGHLAIGYSNGSVKIYDVTTREEINTYTGHRSAISALDFDKKGHRLATGSKDTDVVVWDIISECGLHRLNGHSDVVTDVKFMNTRENVIVTSSKDTFIKFWNLVGGYCFKTLTGHVMEVWSICLMRNDSYLIAGSCDSELRVWKIGVTLENKRSSGMAEHLEDIDDNKDDVLNPLACEKYGSILRQGRGRVVSLTADDTGSILGCHGNEKCVELFHFLSDDEATKKFLKKRKKQAKKLAQLGETLPDLCEKENKFGLVHAVTRLSAIKTDAKVKSLSLLLTNSSENKIKLAISQANNSLKVCSAFLEKDGEVTSRDIKKGHEKEVRVVSFSNDSNQFVSGSSSTLRIWNRFSMSSTSATDVGYVLSACFAPGDEYVLAGTKEGTLVIVNALSGLIVEEINAHQGEIWSVCAFNRVECATGGGDKTVKLWKMETMENEKNKYGVLSLLHARTLKLDESVLCVKVSPDNKLIAVALLDCTVKIFFLDTLKFFLSLYGHKLPVTCLDISHDSKIIATGGADRNVKIWGLDFGDCHKSIFAHENSIMSVAFVPNERIFVTCGKDGFIKIWDASTFERIQTLKGHCGEAWCVAVSLDGNHAISCGQDNVIRSYERTESLLVLEDERETEREQEEETTLATGADSFVPGHKNFDYLSSKKTVKAEKAAELLLECVELSTQFNESLAECAIKNEKPPTIPLIMTAFHATTTEEYLLAVIKKIPSSELEQTLILLPITAVSQLLKLLLPLLKKCHADVEVILRIIFFLLHVHTRPIVATQNLLPLLEKIEKFVNKRVDEVRDMVGVNYYGLTFLQRLKEEKEGVQMFEDVILEKKKSELKKRKREKVARVALLKL